MTSDDHFGFLEGQFGERTIFLVGSGMYTCLRDCCVLLRWRNDIVIMTATEMQQRQELSDTSS